MKHILHLIFNKIFNFNAIQYICENASIPDIYNTGIHLQKKS